MRSDHPRRGGTVQVVRGAMCVTCPTCRGELRVGVTTVAYVAAKERPTLDLYPDPQDYSTEADYVRAQDRYQLGQLEMDFIPEAPAPSSAHLFPEPSIGRLVFGWVNHQIRRLAAFMLARSRRRGRVLGASSHVASIKRPLSSAGA